MGRIQAQGMAEMGLSLEALLTWHMQHNHYPPVPAEFIPAAAEAIELLNDGYGYDENVVLPPGCTVDGQMAVTVGFLVENLHLDSFLDTEGE